MLNDNEMSISPTVGALSNYLSEIKLSSAWRAASRAYDRRDRAHPGRRAAGARAEPTAPAVGRELRAARASCSRTSGITYIGVIPGHDLRALEETFRRALSCTGPVIVHVRTQKGKGYRPAEADQIGFHGAALPPMTLAPRADAYGHDGSPASAAAQGSSVTRSADADEAPRRPLP